MEEERSFPASGRVSCTDIKEEKRSELHRIKKKNSSEEPPLPTSNLMIGPTYGSCQGGVMIFGFFMVISTLAAWSAVLLYLYDNHERPEQPPYEWIHTDGRWEEA